MRRFSSNTDIESGNALMLASMWFAFAVYAVPLLSGGGGSGNKPAGVGASIAGNTVAIVSIVLVVFIWVSHSPSMYLCGCDVD